VDINQIFLSHGVYYVYFSRNWYEDVTAFHHIEWLNEQFKIVPIDLGIVHMLEPELLNHEFLFHGKQVNNEVIWGQVLLWNTRENELFEAGYYFEADYGDSEFRYSDFPLDVMRAAKAKFNSNQDQNLKHHQDVFVRLQVVKNKNVPMEVLRELSFDLEFVVSNQAIRRRLEVEKFPDEFFLEIARHERSIEFLRNHYRAISLGSQKISPFSRFRLAQALNLFTEDTQLEILADDFNWQIQLAVLNHSNSSQTTKTKALNKLKGASRLVQFELANAVQSPIELLEILHGFVQSESVKWLIEFHPNFKKRSRFVD
jgi:hypothetical protein